MSVSRPKDLGSCQHPLPCPITLMGGGYRVEAFGFEYEHDFLAFKLVMLTWQSSAVLAVNRQESHTKSLKTVLSSFLSLKLDQRQRRMSRHSFFKEVPLYLILIS